MKAQIDKDVLAFKIDTTAETITKRVALKNSTVLNASKKTEQGTIYVHRQYIGRTVLFLLIEPRDELDIRKSLSCNGKEVIYFDMLMRDVKSAPISKKYTTGKVYFPSTWVGKKIIGIILSE